MQDQPLSATLPSPQQGSRTTPVGAAASRPALNKYLRSLSPMGPISAAGKFSDAIFSGKNIPRNIPDPVSKGTPEFSEGPVPWLGSSLTSALGPVSDLEFIRGADLGPTGTLVAQILWSMRGFVSATLASTRPFQEWGIDEIVSAARGSSR